MTQTYTLRLDDERATLERVGGKGTALTEMVRAGLPVPDGFHITTTAYQRFVAQNNLQSDIQAALATVDLSQPATLEAASQAIGTLFAKARLHPT
jgi:pyruvate,water dikinase